MKYATPRFRAKTGHARLSRDGMIVGGNCDRAHHARASREAGAYHAFERAETDGCIKPVKRSRSIRFVKPLHLGWRCIAEMGNAEFQIGMFRAEDVIEALVGKTLPYETVLVLIDRVMSAQFGIAINSGDSPLDMIKFIADEAKGKSTGRFGLAPPHQPAIFEQRRKRGEFAMPKWNPF